MKIKAQVSLNIVIFVFVGMLFSQNAFASDHRHGKAGHHRSKISVLTQNMDAGTDFKYLFAVPDPFDLLTAATLTYGEVLKSNIPKRAEAFANIIAQTRPDFISLQEVTVWETLSNNLKTTTLFDQLELLLTALKKLKQPYLVAVSQELSKGTLPIDPNIIGRLQDRAKAVSFTDMDVILVRADAKHSDITLSGEEKHVYSTLLPLPILNTYSFRGWVSVNANIRGNDVRIVGTHLETIIPLIPDTTLVQEIQATELTSSLKDSTTPVVIAGDFNADAEFAKIGPDQSDTPNIALDAGYTDTWHFRHPNKPGYTWPLFNEDSLIPNPFPDPAEIGPYERIDLIYERGLKIANVTRVGYLDGGFPSDHLGVLATLGFGHDVDHKENKH